MSSVRLGYCSFSLAILVIRFSVSTLNWKTFGQHFDWRLQSSSGQKWRKHEQTVLWESTGRPCERDKTFIHSGICIGGHSPIHQEEINISSIPCQGTEATGREDIIHPDDTYGGVLQPKWRTGSPRSLDHNDEEAKTEQRSALCSFLLPVTHILSIIL